MQRNTSSRAGYAQSTSLILLDSSPPASLGKENVSVEAMTHTVVDGDYVEKEDDTPLSVLFGIMKKIKVMSSTSKDLTEVQVDDRAQGTETLNNFEDQGTESLGAMDEQGVEILSDFEQQGTEAPGEMDEQGIEVLNDFEEQGIETHGKLNEKGNETVDRVKMQGTETLSNIEVLSVETLDDIKMQELKGGQDNFELDDDDTCLELTAKNYALKELRSENSTLYLNS